MQEIGSSMEEISESAESHQVPSFNDSVRQFADAVCRVMVASAQVSPPYQSTVHLSGINLSIYQFILQMVSCDHFDHFDQFITMEWMCQDISHWRRPFISLTLVDWIDYIPSAI